MCASKPKELKRKRSSQVTEGRKGYGLLSEKDNDFYLKERKIETTSCVRGYGNSPDKYIVTRGCADGGSGGLGGAEKIETVSWEGALKGGLK